MARKTSKGRSKGPTGVFREIEIASERLNLAKDAVAATGKALSQVRQRVRKMRAREVAGREEINRLKEESRNLKAKAEKTGKHFQENRLILLELAIFTINKIQGNGRLPLGKGGNLNITALAKEMQNEAVNKRILIESEDRESKVENPVITVKFSVLTKQIGNILRGDFTKKKSKDSRVRSR